MRDRNDSGKKRTNLTEIMKGRNDGIRPGLIHGERGFSHINTLGIQRLNC